MNKFQTMFDYYRDKHSDLMIYVNSQKRNVINLEDDSWDDERVQPYLTRFNTYHSSSSDSNDPTQNSHTENSQASSTQKTNSVSENKNSSVVSNSEKSEKEEKAKANKIESNEKKKNNKSGDDEDKDHNADDDDTLLYQNDQIANFDDISESGEGPKMASEIKSNKPLPASFDKQRMKTKTIINNREEFIKVNRQYIHDKSSNKSSKVVFNAAQTTDQSIKHGSIEQSPETQDIEQLEHNLKVLNDIDSNWINSLEQSMGRPTLGDEARLMLQQELKKDGPSKQNEPTPVKYVEGSD